MTGVAGDGQSAPTGTTLPIPLSFIVLSTTGQPLAGVTVGWTVTTGAASLNPTSSTTDASGSASTTVTLGGTVGPVIVRGTVAGITPVDFHLDATDPCLYKAPYTLGATVNGVLTTSDCRIAPGYYYDFYGFTVATQQGFTANMTAGFDAYLELYMGSDLASVRIVGFNDDISGANLNSRVQAIVAPGNYVLAPNTSLVNVTGAYTLTTASRPQTLAGCAEQIWVTRGVTITDGLSVGDCPDTVAAGVFYSDIVWIIGFPGDTLKFTQRSAAFDPMVTLFRFDGIGFVVVASNDDSTGTTTDAFVSYPVTGGAAIFVASMSSFDPAATGAYTIEVSGYPPLLPGPRFVAAWGTIRAGQSFAPLRVPKTLRWH